MLGCLPKGIRERVGLLLGKASIGQATDNRTGIEYKSLKGGGGRTMAGRQSFCVQRFSIPVRPGRVPVVRWNPMLNGGCNEGNHRQRIS